VNDGDMKSLFGEAGVKIGSDRQAASKKDIRKTTRWGERGSGGRHARLNRNRGAAANEGETKGEAPQQGRSGKCAFKSGKPAENWESGDPKEREGAEKKLAGWGERAFGHPAAETYKRRYEPPVEKKREEEGRLIVAKGRLRKKSEDLGHWVKLGLGGFGQSLEKRSVRRERGGQADSDGKTGASLSKEGVDVGSKSTKTKKRDKKFQRSRSKRTPSLRLGQTNKAGTLKWRQKKPTSRSPLWATRGKAKKKKKGLRRRRGYPTK